MRRLLIVTMVVAASACPPLQEGTCADGVRNGSESDVDCGGRCGACAEAKACLAHDDCDTGLCRLHVCAKPPAPCDGGGCGVQVQCRRNADCAPGVCLDGLCMGSCGPPLLTCNLSCVDPRFDPLNCGGCGSLCRPGERCELGSCRAECPFGLISCGVGPAQRCVNAELDVLHCGDCTTVCEQGERCVNGSCSLDCAPFQTECGGQCVVTQTDLLNCGRCATPCPPGRVCSMGLCAPGCTPPATSCDGGACVDLRFDPMNCGACGFACPIPLNAAPLCLDMTCTRTRCFPGFEDCNGFPGDGCEAKLIDDPMNCGTCGRVCLGGPCMNGNCS